MILILMLFLEEGILCKLFNISNATEEICLVVSLFLLIINTVALFVYINQRYQEYDAVVCYMLVFSLIFKVSLLLWDYYGTSIFVLPNSHIDSESFHRSAIYFAQYGVRRVENYSYVVGWIYRFFGIQRITAQYFNVILSFWGIDILERTLRNFDLSDKCIERTLIIASILPNYAIISAILIRECIISFILCVALYYFSFWWATGSFFYFIVAELVSMIACWFHSGAIAATIGMAIAVVVVRRGEDGTHHLQIGFTSIVLSILLFVVFMYLFDALSDSILKRFHGLDIEVIDEYIDDHHFYTEVESPSSAYSAGRGGINGVRGIIINSPIRILFFLWSPMPWNLRGLNDLIAFIGSSMFYGGVMTASLTQIIRRKIDNKLLSPLIVLFIIAFCGALVFAWGVDSAGSALRHREKFFYIFLLLYAVYEENHLISSVESR